jgi:predicted dehydrogenase
MPGKVTGVVRVAIIGPGGISGAHGRGYLKYSDKIKVVALCDINDENMKRRSDQLGGVANQYKDWKLMLKELAGDLDAVDICLPHHLHAPAILDAAAAGLHILCEKPMCVSLKQADEIAKAVSKASITYMSAHNQLFMPAVQEAKRMVESGELGRICWMKSQDCFRAGNTHRSQWGWRADLKTQGGGELIDTGYHPTYRLLHIVGARPVEVRATMGRFVHDIDGEDTACVSVRFDNGAIGEILTSWAMNNPFGTHQVHLVGEAGQVFGSENTLYYLPKGYSEPAMRSFQPIDTFEAEISHFADCLREGKRPIHGVEEGRAVLEVILKAAESAEGWQKTAVLKH